MRRYAPPPPQGRRYTWYDIRLQDMRRAVSIVAASHSHGWDTVVRQVAYKLGLRNDLALFVNRAEPFLQHVGSMRPLHMWRAVERRPHIQYWSPAIAARVIDLLISAYGADADPYDALAAYLGARDAEQTELSRAVCERQRALAGAQAVSTDHAASTDASRDGAQDDSDAAATGPREDGGDDNAATDNTDRSVCDSVSARDAIADTPDPEGGDTLADADGTTGTSGASTAHDTPRPGDDVQPAADPEGERGADEVTASGMGSGHDPASAEDEAEETGEYAASDAASAEAGNHAGDGGCRSGVAAASLAEVSEVARIARALSRLAADTACPDPTALWDGRRVVRELLSRQVRLHRMRKDMRVPKAVLILYDMSGSCAWIAERTWGIATALAARYPSLLAAPTASAAGPEGTLAPEEIEGRSVAMRTLRRCPHVRSGDHSGWLALRSANITHMLVFGDAHGIDGYLAAVRAGIKVLMANPNADIAPHHDQTRMLSGYCIIDGLDIASAVEQLVRPLAR